MLLLLCYAVARYSLPHLTPEGNHLLRCRPHIMSLNCNASKLAIIDLNGLLTFFDFAARTDGTSQR